jgi:hypothetical protein
MTSRTSNQARSKSLDPGKKVKQSHYRPGEAFRIPGRWGSQIFRQLAHDGGKVVSPTHRPPLPPQEIFLVLISVRAWVNPTTIVRPEGLCQWKIAMTPSEIEPATFRLVVHCLNQPCPRLSQKSLGIFVDRARLFTGCSSVPQPSASLFHYVNTGTYCK